MDYNRHIKIKQSRLNLLKAHLDQLENSVHFTDLDREKLIPYYNKQIENTKLELHALHQKRNNR